MMLGEELLEALGAAPLLLAVLIPFWVGDEALSREFRRDIACWLRRMAHVGVAADEQGRGRLEVAGVVLSVFEHIYGVRVLSLGFMIRSVIVSLGLLTIVMSTVEAVNVARFDADPLIFGAFEGLAIFVMMAITNAAADYVSLVETRAVLWRMAASGRRAVVLVILDAILTSVIFAFFFCMAYVLVGVSIVGFEVITGGLARLVADLWSAHDGPYWFWGLSLTENWAIMGIPLITTFVTSAWIWAAVLGSLGIRLLAAGGPMLRRLLYALPVDDKPVRSIGVMATLITLAILLIAAIIPESPPPT